MTGANRSMDVVKKPMIAHINKQIALWMKEEISTQKKLHE